MSLDTKILPAFRTVLWRSGLLFVVALLSACGDGSDEQMDGLGSYPQNEYVEGRDFIRLEQSLRTADPSRIELALVFSYHDPKSFSFEPLIQSWQHQIAEDVYLLRVHAMWNPQMEPLIRGYYTSVALNISEQTHMDVFHKIHVERENFNSAQEWANFFANYGIEKAKTMSIYNSFNVTSMIKQAEARARAFKITGTPELVVNGKYRISSRLVNGDAAEMLSVADYLIALERANRK